MSVFGQKYQIAQNLLSEIYATGIVTQRARLDKFLESSEEKIGIFHRRIFIETKSKRYFNLLDDSIQAYPDLFPKIQYKSKDEEILLWDFDLPRTILPKDLLQDGYF